MKTFSKKPSMFMSTRSILMVAALAAFPILSVVSAGAAPIMDRSVTMSSSAGDASGVTYTLDTSALPTTGTAVKSIELKICTSLSDGCSSTPAGFSSAASTLASQPSGLGAPSGWTVNTATTGSLRISNSGNSTNPSGAVQVVWNGVHNPTANNTTFYGIITTYSDATWTTAIDTGSVALSTSSQVHVTLDVDESLTFCAGTSITGQNCATISGTTVDLGNGTDTSTATGESILAASTNGTTGYSIVVNGSTLTSGSDTIDALSSGDTSVIGTKQFGLNLAAANTVPPVGAVVSGTGTGAPTANYNINNTFRFANGDIIATASGPTNANAYTVGYIANIDGSTAAGVYTTTLTYTATANF